LSAPTAAVRRDITRVNARRLGPLPADAGDMSIRPSIPGPTEPVAQTLELSPTTPIRVLLVDNHGIFRIGLRQLLEQEGFSVIDADSAQTALRRSAQRVPDVVVMGVNRPAACDGEAISLIREAVPSAAVLALALVMDDAHVLRAVRAGVVGYLLKDAELERIVAGIRDVACGQSALSAGVARVVMDALRHSTDPGAPGLTGDVPALSERERAVLSLLASGCDNSQIGDRLFVSHGTVKSYVSRILEKLEVDNRVQAATYAVRAQLV
jgi:two-component system NarL family response regulator